VLLGWLRNACDDYSFDVVALYRRHGEHEWPLQAEEEADLERQLGEGGHFLPLPKEPAALANIVEVSVVDYLLECAEVEGGLEAVRGTERGYPDIEFSGKALAGEFHAVDVKVARRGPSRKRTQSRITLYTGNTYFRYPQLRWPGTFRPFQDYRSHLDVLCIYDLNPEARSRVENLELIVQEAWRIGSRQRSSTTREYLGAVDSIESLRGGKGEFETADDFYRYWRRYPFRIGRTVQQQLDRLLAQQGGNSG
jgi:Restriction endonuclease EcoRV